MLNLKWEYRDLFINPGEYVTDRLNDLGNDGWECFAINFTDVGTQCFLKKAAIATMQR